MSKKSPKDGKQEPMKIAKVFRAEIKAIDEKEFTVTAVVSTDAVDRDGEIVTPEAIGKRVAQYLEHPVLLSSHRHDDLMKQIGMAVDVKVGEKGVTAKFKYFVGQGNAEADWAFKLAQNGIAAYSIGFMAHKWEDKSGDDGIWRVYRDVELVEISQVLVPSNREALSARLASTDHVEKELVEMAIKTFDKPAEDPKDPEEKPQDPPAEPAQEDPKPAEAAATTETTDPDPATEKTDEIAEKIAQALLGNDAFISKIAEAVVTSVTKNKKNAGKTDDGGEGYFEEVLGDAAGRPDASPDGQDLKSFFGESVNRHFKKE